VVKALPKLVGGMAVLTALSDLLGALEEQVA
jgi:hypothetical protein